MTPFKDQIASIGSRPEYPITSAPSDDTIKFDAYRQGVEVTLTQYFLRSTLPYMSSKGIQGGEIGKPVNHELDHVNFGQGMNLDGFTPYEELNEVKSAAEVLVSNIIQSDEDPFFGRAAQDGQIDIFSDTGKRSLVSRPDRFLARGVKGLFVDMRDVSKVDTYDSRIFYDAADEFLGVVVEGYGGYEDNFEPFKDVKLLNKFDIEIDYTYIGPDENVASRGYDYYGSTSGTDSIAFGGFLR